MRKCIVCDADMAAGLASWHFICAACGYEGATLAPRINDHAAHSAIKEADREAGLKSIRSENFRVILRAIARLAPPGGKTLLDVGSAHGWFLRQAAPMFTATGIEPDEPVAAKARLGGLAVRAGYFPSALDGDEKFDVIVFNDVIEHIPSITEAIDACVAHLHHDGVLVLNLPSSTGFFYRLSKLLARLGWPTPFERLWQKDLPSPHVHYFSLDNLVRLARDRRFDLLTTFELPSVRAKGLLQRMRWTGKLGGVSLWAQYLCILGALPLIRLFRSDINVAIFRRRRR